MQNEYQFIGMHLAWWIVWVLFLLWVFTAPYEIPGRRLKRKSAMHLLQRRFAAGKISYEQYAETLKLLEQHIHTAP